MVLQEAGIPASAVHTTIVPGSFEIPLACKKLIEDGITLRHAQGDSRVAGIMALGVIIQGETFHAQEIARACTDAIMHLQLTHGVPIAHGVLYCKTMQQAQERCLGKHNKGEEAARTLLHMLTLLQAEQKPLKNS